MKINKIALFMLPVLTEGGGAEKYFIDLAKNLTKRGIKTDIVTMDDKFFRKFGKLLHIVSRGDLFKKIDIGREKEFEITKNLGNARWLKTNFKNLGNILSSYDIIYSKNEIVDLLLLKIKGYRNLPPIIVGIHTPLRFQRTNSLISKLHNFFYSGLVYKWLLAGTKCIHVSNISAKKFCNQKFKLESKLIYYPFSIKEVNMLAEKHKPEIIFPHSKINIAFIGRLSEQKGIDTIIYLIDKFVKKNDNKIQLNIFGSGDTKYENELRKLSEIHSFIHYFGHVENKFIPSILNQQDLMIAPSKWETLPFSILEAQAMGVPVIAFNIPGPSDIIENGRTGFLVSTKEEFFEKTENFIKGNIFFDKNDIIRNVKNKFDPEIKYSEMTNLFNIYL